MALHENQLEMLGERLVPLFQQFEAAVISDIARRLRKTGRLTETAELMAKGLRGKGFSPSTIRRQVMIAIKADAALQKEIAENTLAAKQALQEEINLLRSKMDPEIRVAVETAADFAFNNDLEVWKGDRLPIKGSAFERLVRAMRDRVGDELLNLTKTTAFRFQSGMYSYSQDTYVNSVNLAFAKVATGTYSYQQALEEAVRELAKSGLRAVNFESGKTMQLDSAVRGAILTASSQLAGQITMMNVDETGVELVEVSKHWGARTGRGHGNHAAWQGGIYRVNGSDEKHRNLEEATGYPSDPKGLHGYNCRHSFYPFWEGISKPNEWPEEPEPVTIDGKTYTYYQLTQMQRKMEREIRATQREVYAYREAGLMQKASQAKSRAKAMIEEYNQFSDSVGISPKPSRLRVVYVRKQQAS